MEKVLFATGNRGKVEEMQPLFGEKGYELEQVQVDIEEIDALDVETVAKRKAEDSFEEIDGDEPVIVEDTGFFVEPLGGFPGAKAAFFDRTVGAEGLLKLLEGESDRTAYFRTAIAFHDGSSTRVFSASVDGQVPGEPRGEPHPHLPYDSLFVPWDGDGSTFAERPELKEEISHREKATRKFLDWLSSR
ncbi:MAG: non-canonical purine NTP pyrophosphatase [Candidatus Nanohaloarchaea archaeon]